MEDFYLKGSSYMICAKDGLLRYYLKGRLVYTATILANSLESYKSHGWIEITKEEFCLDLVKWKMM